MPATQQKIYLDDSGNPIKSVEQIKPVQQKKVYLDDDGNPVSDEVSISDEIPLPAAEPIIPDEMPGLPQPQIQPQKQPSFLSQIWDAVNYSPLPDVRTSGTKWNYESKDPSQIIRQGPADTFASGFDESLAKTMYDETIKPAITPLGAAATFLGGPLSRGALKLARKIPGAATVESILNAPIFGKKAVEVIKDTRITDPARLLQANNQQARFVGGEAGVADTTKDYSTMFGGENIPRSAESIAAHGAVPEVIPPVQEFMDVPVVTAGETLTKPGGALIRSRIPSMRSTTPDAIDAPSRVADYGIRNTGTNPQITPGHTEAGTNQQIFDALLPSRIKEQIGMRNVTPATSEVVQNIEMQRVAKPIENPIPKTAPIIDVKDKVVPPVLDKATKSSTPEIAKAAAQVAELRSKDKSFFRKAVDPYVTSGLSVLDNDSDAGKAISTLVQQTRTEGEQLAGSWSNRYKKITRDLNKDEWDNFVQAAEGTAAPLNPKVADVLQQYKLLDAEVSQAATDSGMIMSNYEGDIIPFKPVKEYWPRIYPKNFVESKRTDIFDELIQAGNSPEEAEKIISNSTKFGNRLISPQHARQADIGGYRTDREAYLLHLDQMGKRIAESKNFGPRDLGDASSPLSELVKGTRDKRYVTEILDRHLGRVRPGNQASDDLAGKANSLAAMTDLGLFTISNQAQKAVIPIRSDLKAFAKALTEFKTQAGQDFAEQSGALQTALRDSIQDLGGEHWVSRLYRTGASERSNRTLAAITGKFTAQADFSRLQKIFKTSSDPALLQKMITNSSELERLSNLLMASPDDVITLARTQPFLDEKQLLTAGARMSEITQGRAGTIDLPSEWRASPQMKLMSMYKGYAFRQTKAMKDAALENPGKFIAVGLPLLALTGEAVGSTKAGIRGGLSGEKTAADEIVNRGKDNMVDKILKSANTPEKTRWLASRVAEDLSEAWVIGILGDLIGSSGQNPTGLIKFIAGPVAGMAADVGFGAIKSLQDLSLKPVASHTVKTFVPTPFGYPASQADIFKKDKDTTTGKRR